MQSSVWGFVSIDVRHWSSHVCKPPYCFVGVLPPCEHSVIFYSKKCLPFQTHLPKKFKCCEDSPYCLHPRISFWNRFGWEPFRPQKLEKVPWALSSNFYWFPILIDGGDKGHKFVFFHGFCFSGLFLFAVLHKDYLFVLCSICKMSCILQRNHSSVAFK